MAQQNDSKATVTDAPMASESVKASSGLDAAAKDVGSETAAPYGTRSRNRTGNARPNYAEDKDIDMDNYDYYRGKSNPDSSKKSARHSNAAAANADGPPRGGGGSRKPLVDDGRAAGTVQNGPKVALSSTSDGGGVSGEGGSGSENSSRCSSSNNNGSSTAAATAAAAAAGAGGAGGGGGGGAKGASQAAQAPQLLRKRKAAATVAAKRPGNAVQPTGPTIRETNMMTFEQSSSYPEHGQMKADDGTLLAPNDHVYLVCEPPGEPYYLGRIMEFLPPQTGGPRPVEAVRINWFYRPKDIGRKAVDTRQVFATMHSDVSPLTALRGKCRIVHRGEIDNIDQFRKTPDSFWFEKLYDRYIQKNYDLLPTSSIVNVPDRVKKVLDERWKYVLVEQGRGKELISAAKLCKRCTNYCASNDSVDCAVCHNTYHMNCVRPPLLKKPSRGFAWSCAACSRAQERKLEARNTPSGADASGDVDDDEFLDDDEDAQAMGTDRTTPAELAVPHQGSPEQVYQASLWPWRYLGMHCKPEDALDYDDRIYPRASTRIGPRHQANVTLWPGQPVQYVKPAETKKGFKGQKVSKEAQYAEKALRGKRPKWVQDQPPGYLARGEDYDENDARATSTLLWKPPATGLGRGQSSDEYANKAQSLAKKLGLPELSTNLRDVALEKLLRYEYDMAKALEALLETEREVFKEPEPTAAEQKKFEEAVSKFGSELHMVKKHVKTLSPGEVVRYYYKWKKTERGSKVWGSYSGRKGKKQTKRAEAVASKFADDVADNDDDSAFDTTKAMEKKRSFICMFCSTTSSRQWRRAPNVAPGVVNDPGNKSKDKGGQYLIALCRRCAELWRRYGIRFEEMEEVAKKIAQSGGRAWRRKQDEELLKELQAAQEMGLITPDRDATPMSGVVGVAQEPPRKKLKGAPSDNREAEMACSDGGGGGAASSAASKKDKLSDGTPVPEMPKPRTLPCAVCDQMEPLGDQHVSCRECRLTVHRNCYGIVDNRIQGKWICDMCSNDKSPQVSTHYKCVLCPVEYTEKDFVEQPRLTHHKKKMSDKDRERERLEVQQARKATEYYRKKQEEMNRPVNPREPLKRTTDNNWVHVTCAVWTPEVKFGNAKALEPSEGIPSIAKSIYDESCQACKQQGGACAFCHQCRLPYHVECARQQGHLLGFDVTPIKSSRRDQFNTVTFNGESGIMSAVVWCKDHVPTKTFAYRPHDVVSKSGLNALQLYVQNYKQADLALTGTVRKTNLMINAAKVSGAAALANGTRRISATTTTATTPAVTANGPTSLVRSSEADKPTCNAPQAGDKVCISCGIDVTPRWWPIDDSLERRLTNGHHGVIGSEAQKFVEQRKFQCHSCRKSARRPKLISPRPSPPTRDHGSLQNQNVGNNGQMTGVPSLRSPQPGPPEYRPIRSEIHALHHPASHAGPPPHQQQQQPLTPLADANPPAHAGPIAAPAPGPPPTHAPGHAMGSRPAAVSHAYPAVHPPRQGPYNDWSHQAVHQAVPRHSSPPRHLNGGPPPILGGMSSLSSLRPPAISGPPPAMTPLPTGHHHAHGSPLYANSLPTSPRRLGGPAPPVPCVPSYHGGPAHGNPGPHGASPSLSNGVPPPRTDGISHSLHPQRSPYSGSHGSPLMSRSGPLPPHEPTSSIGPRAPESRPASGASASPSLHNLLS